MLTATVLAGGHRDAGSEDDDDLAFSNDLLNTEI